MSADPGSVRAADGGGVRDAGRLGYAPLTCMPDIAVIPCISSLQIQAAYGPLTAAECVMLGGDVGSLTCGSPHRLFIQPALWGSSGASYASCTELIFASKCRLCAGCNFARATKA